MNAYEIVSDTSHDMPSDFVKKHNIHLVAFGVTVDDGKSYMKERIELSRDDLYKYLYQGVFPKTSLPSMEEYMEVCRPILANNKDIVILTISHKLSGSFQSATVAKDILLEEYPDRKIEIIDSNSVSMGQGILLYEMVRMKENNLSLEELVDITNKIKYTVEAFITVDSLKYLEKGGRIGTAGALAGSLLNIKPIIALRDGFLQGETSVRGRRRALKKIYECFNKTVGGKEEKYQVFAIHSDPIEDAIKLEEKVKEENNLSLTIPPQKLGATVASHIGPTAAALGYILKYEYADEL